MRTCLVGLIHRKIECVPLLRCAAEDDSAFSVFVVRLSFFSLACERGRRRRKRVDRSGHPGWRGWTDGSLRGGRRHLRASLRARQSWHRCVLKRLLGNQTRMKEFRRRKIKKNKKTQWTDETGMSLEETRRLLRSPLFALRRFYLPVCSRHCGALFSAVFTAAIFSLALA